MHPRQILQRLHVRKKNLLYSVIIDAPTAAIDIVSMSSFPVEDESSHEE